MYTTGIIIEKQEFIADVQHKSYFLAQLCSNNANGILVRFLKNKMQVSSSTNLPFVLTKAQ